MNRTRPRWRSAGRIQPLAGEGAYSSQFGRMGNHLRLVRHEAG